MSQLATRYAFSHTSRRNPFRVTAFFLTSSLLLAACTSPDGTEAGPSDADAAGYPRTLDNCGHEVTAEAPPERAVSLNQGSTEILLSLGLEDRIVGSATWTDPVMDGLEEAADAIPRLAENQPSFERVLDTEPDFVSASFASTVGQGGVATRDQFEDLGVPAYVSPSDCAWGKDNEGGGDGSRSEELTLDAVYEEIEDLAHLFDAEDRGDELVGELQSRVDTATEGLDASDVSLMYWFANSESPFLAGCCGAPGAITAEIGAENAFDDTDEEWPQINWETVADRDPDVIVLGDLTRDSQTAESAEEKIAFLADHPATSNLTAVQEERYVLLSGQAMNPSIRTVEGVEQVADGLRDLGLAQ